MPDRDEGKPLEGEILPGDGFYERERMTFRVVKISWLGQLMLALVAIALLAIALFISFWILVLFIPLVLAMVILAWLQRLRA